MRELMALTAKQRSEGTFDPAAVETGIKTIAPMLTEEQRRRLEEITKKL